MIYTNKYETTQKFDTSKLVYSQLTETGHLTELSELELEEHRVGEEVGRADGAPTVQ